MPLSCGGRSCPVKMGGRTSTGAFTCTIPSVRWWTCSTVGGRKPSTPCGNCNTPGWWRSRSRAVENPTAFSQNPMKRFQTPTSRNPVLVRRRTENRTLEVRKSLPGSTKTGRYIEIQRLKRLIYILSIPILSELFSAGFSLWKTPDGKGMGKGAEWHNTQFCGLRSTRATRQGRWKPITKDRKNNTPAIPTLTPAGVNTTSISSSGRDAITTSFRAVLNSRGAAPERTAPGLSIRSSPPARCFSRENPQRRYRRFPRGRQSF